MKHLKLIMLMVLFATTLSSCVSRKKTIVLYNRPETLETIEHAKNIENYLLKPGDLLHIKILSINQETTELFNTEKNNSSSSNITGDAPLYLKGFSINDSGYIKLPVIDTVHVSGLTIDEAENKIQIEVNKYFKNSTLIVKLINNSISILGEVSRPGAYHIYKKETTIFELLATAGGTTTYADLTKVLVLRRYENKSETYRINLTDVDLIESEQLFLQPGDVVVVDTIKYKHFRNLEYSNITLLLSAITTTILILNFVMKL